MMAQDTRFVDTINPQNQPNRSKPIQVPAKTTFQVQVLIFQKIHQEGIQKNDKNGYVGKYSLNRKEPRAGGAC